MKCDRCYEGCWNVSILRLVMFCSDTRANIIDLGRRTEKTTRSQGY